VERDGSYSVLLHYRCSDLSGIPSFRERSDFEAFWLSCGAALSQRANLADVFSDLGRREEALTAAQEAADLYRALARARPEDLAMSLNTLAIRLSALRLGDDAEQPRRCA
jgi:Tetratricopeptide repeat